MPCTRTSCCYHAEPNKPYGCNYMSVTGTSKLAQMPPNVTYSVEDCPFYKNGKRRTAPKGEIVMGVNPLEVIRQVSTLDEDEVKQLYDLNLCDSDIALLLNVLPQAIAKFRREKGLIRSMSKSGGIRRINWEEVNKMIADGYSDIAVSMFVSVPLEVIQIYKVMCEKKKAEGGQDETDSLQKAFDGEGG